MDMAAIELWEEEYYFKDGMRKLIKRLIDAGDRTKLEATCNYLAIMGYTYEIRNAFDRRRWDREPWPLILIER